jgi:hypothetical protein
MSEKEKPEPKALEPKEAESKPRRVDARGLPVVEPMPKADSEGKTPAVRRMG